MTEELFAGEDLGAGAPPGRPRAIANFALTLDGRAAVGGRSGPIGGIADRAVFHALRGGVDAVLAGTATLAAERYGRLVRDPARRARREAAGLAPDPLAVLVTRSGEVPWDIPLFADAQSRVVIHTVSAALEVPAVPADVEVVRHPPGTALLAGALTHLRHEDGVRSLLCEGGPTLLAALLRDALLDELFLTVAPLLVGGEEPLTLTAGPPLLPPNGLELTWALEHESALFLRYAIREETMNAP